MAVEVFKTNVTDTEVANNIVRDLTFHLHESKVNFDLADCDRILRIESSKEIHIQSISEHLVRWGYIVNYLNPNSMNVNICTITLIL